MVEDLFSDQAVLAILPIVTLGIIVGAAGFYLLWKERRESREQQAKRN